VRNLFSVPVREETAGKKQEEQPRVHDKTDPYTVEAEDSRRIRERIAGCLMVLLVLAVSTGVVVLILQICRKVHPCLRLLAEGILCGRLLALRSLGEAGFAVRDPLRKGDIEGARHAVSMIVGRDTESLDREGVIRAAVETVAENTADGVIAPLFYLALGGAVGGMVYKAVNTMDSMLGYKNERYQYFGTAAARLDDVAGFVPARLSGLLLVAAAGLTGMDAAGAWRIFCRDRYAHKSPNSAQSESAVAGALGVRLAGDAVYGGVVVHKPTIGEPCREIEAEDIPRACRLMYAAFGLGLSAVTAILILCLWRSGAL
jgi:adenosylcobinamide-phosphate synthase